MRALKGSRAASERERWPRERLERFQQERLDALARHAREHSPFWRERLPDGPVRLTDLPVLTKAEMMDRYDDLVTDRRLGRDELLEHLDGIDGDSRHLGDYRVMTTSGSSGLKGLFAYDREAWGALLQQFFRYTEWAGFRPAFPRRRVMAIGGAAGTHMTRRVAASVDFGMHRVRSLAVTQPVEELVAELNRFRPDYLNAYPSIAAILADEQRAGRLRIDLRAMSTSSELLTPTTRERLRSAFGVDPTDVYGTTEGLWGCDCEEHSGLHLFEDGCIVENVDADGHPVPLGERGTRLLVTNLFNRTQPLIRFELSDMVTFAPGPCACGRTLRRLQALDGRADDVIELGGVAVHPLQFAFVTADPDVREFQVVQRGERIVLRVALRGEDPEAPGRLRDRLWAKLAGLGVPDPDVEIEEVESLERSSAGKLQIVVSDEPLDQAPGRPISAPSGLRPSRPT